MYLIKTYVRIDKAFLVSIAYSGMHFLDTNEYGSHTGTATLRLSRATTIPWLVPHQETRSANQRAGRRVLGGHVTSWTNEGTARGVGGHCGPLHR